MCINAAWNACFLRARVILEFIEWKGFKITSAVNSRARSIRSCDVGDGGRVWNNIIEEFQGEEDLGYEIRNQKWNKEATMSIQLNQET